MKNIYRHEVENILGPVIFGRRRTEWAGRKIIRSAEDRARGRAAAKAWRESSREHYLDYKRAYYISRRTTINAQRRARYHAAKAE